MEFLKEICELVGTSGYEKDVRLFIEEKIKPYATEVYTDKIGNLIAFKKGKKEGKRVVVSAHMDEVGFMVRYITDDGYLKFECIGGIDERVLAGRRVIFAKSGMLGIISAKAIHIQTPDERKKIVKVKDMYIDIGASSKEEAEKLVSVGDTAVFYPNYEEFGNDAIKSKAIDDRFGCAVMMEILKEELEYDTYFAFTTREEIGCRGAAAVAYALSPDFSIAVETTTAGDICGTPKHMTACRLGNGAVISFMDNGTIYDPKAFRLAEELAKKNEIKYQLKDLVAGGNEASAYQKTALGSLTVAISAPCRYLHSASCVVKKLDLESVLGLVRVLINSDEVHNI